jgi:hypothetical protein
MGIWSISSQAEVVFGTGTLPDSKLNLGRMAGGNTTGQAGMTLTTLGDPDPSKYGTVLSTGLGDEVSPQTANSSLAFDQGDGLLFNQPSKMVRRTRTAMSYVWDGSTMNDSVRAMTTGIRTVCSRRAIRNNQWNKFDGTWSEDPQVAMSGLWSITASQNTKDGSQVDNEGNVSRANQGEFVYQNGSTVVQFGNYDAKTG